MKFIHVNCNNSSGGSWQIYEYVKLKFYYNMLLALSKKKIYQKETI